MPGALYDSLRTENINSTYSKTNYYFYDNKSNRILLEEHFVNYSKTKIIIIDMHGHEIANYNLTSYSRFIDLPLLPCGIHLINLIIVSNKNYAGKIIVLN